MEFSEFLKGDINIKQKTHEMIMDIIDDETDFELEFQNLKKHFQENNIPKDRYELKEILYLISKISNNHHRNINFFDKIEKLINYFKIDTMNNLTNFEIFNIFHSNKRILIYLIEEKIIIPDQSIFNVIKQPKLYEKNYLQYFYPEFKSFFKESLLQRIKNKNPEIFDESFDIFNSKRKKGENDSYICQLIRNDSVEEFISHINRNSISITSLINGSVFETNSFLLKNKKISLIEYAAFYGSIQIFQYLRLSGVELSSTLWFYIIHSHNAEMIHILEENFVEPDDTSYIECYIESIKCHHIDLMNYFHSNYLYDKSKNDLYLYASFKYFNFINIANQIEENEMNENDNEESFHNNFFVFFNLFYYIIKCLIINIYKSIYDFIFKKEDEFIEDNNFILLNYFCKYDYFYYADFLLKNTNVDINNGKFKI